MRVLGRNTGAKDNANLIAALLELMRSRIGRWGM